MRHNRRMSSPAETARPGLRERKKSRTRAAIRNEALRLFREQGYQPTTVEQIAAAAEVSPSTFFRYFPTKEALVLSDEMDPVMLKALEEQPAELGPFAAFRAALASMFDTFTAEDMQRERERQALILAVPELRGAVFGEFTRTVSLVAGVFAARAGRPPDDFESRAFAGAVIGAMQAVAEDSWLTGGPGDNPAAEFRASVNRVLDFMESGMNLGPR
jgi:AcrR family transcriptional regulator